MLLDLPQEFVRSDFMPAELGVPICADKDAVGVHSRQPAFDKKIQGDWRCLIVRPFVPGALSRVGTVRPERDYFPAFSGISRRFCARPAIVALQTPNLASGDDPLKETLVPFVACYAEIEHDKDLSPELAGA
jgi:hypothetical protein